MILTNLFRAAPVGAPATEGTMKSVASTGVQNKDLPTTNLDRFDPSRAEKSPVRIIDADNFVEAFIENGFKNSLPTLGKSRRLPFNITLESLDMGVPLVAASGEEVEKEWAGAPEDKNNCEFKARGVVFVPQIGLVESLKTVFMNPINHPIVLDGIINSKIIKKFEPKEASVFLDAILVQETEEMQYVTHLVGRNIDGGVSFVQKQLSEEEVNQYKSDLFPDKPAHWLRDFLGQIQILEIAGGTVVIMEFKAEGAGVPASCGNAADPGFLGDVASIGNVLVDEKDLKKTVKGRIETRLRRMILSVTNQKWARTHQIQF